MKYRVAWSERASPISRIPRKPIIYEIKTYFGYECYGGARGSVVG
jgi:hypothetical protein